MTALFVPHGRLTSESGERCDKELHLCGHGLTHRKILRTFYFKVILFSDLIYHNPEEWTLFWRRTGKPAQLDVQKFSLKGSDFLNPDEKPSRTAPRALKRSEAPRIEDPEGNTGDLECSAEPWREAVKRNEAIEPC